MPRKAKHQCNHQGCKNLTNDQFCQEHKSQHTWVHADNKSAHKRGYTWGYFKMRLRYLRQNPLCDDCFQKGIIKQAAEVHHKKPLSKGGDNSFDNFKALCCECHNKYLRDVGGQV